jgi:hypothetical protein
MSSKSAASKGTSSTTGALQDMSKDSNHTDKNEASARPSAASLSSEAENTGTSSARDTAATCEAGSYNSGLGDKTKKALKPKTAVGTSANKGGCNPGVIPRDHDASAPAASHGKPGHTSGTLHEDHSNSSNTTDASAHEKKPRSLEDFIGKEFVRYFRTRTSKGRLVLPYKGVFERLQWVSLLSKPYEFYLF